MKSIKSVLSVVFFVAAIPVCDGQQTYGPVIGPGGNHYELVYYPDRTLSWAQAKSEASARNFGSRPGQLATILNERVDVFIETMRQAGLAGMGIDPHGNAAPALWVGGRQERVAGSTVGSDWKWDYLGNPIGGGEFGIGYTNWLPGEPNDWRSVGIEDGQEDYLAIGLRGGFHWHDTGGPLRGYVVEYLTVRDRVVVSPRPGPGGHYYKVVIEPGGVTWDEAMDEACANPYDEQPGHLATVTSAEERDYIEGLRLLALERAGYDLNDPNSHPDLWLGGRQERDQPGVAVGWNWVNGEGRIGGTTGGSGFSDWRAGEPNDWRTAAEDNEENYLTTGLRGDPTWNDGGGRRLGYVVEYELPRAAERVVRSMHYGGDAGTRFVFDAAIAASASLTVEGWVYREVGTRRETVALVHRGGNRSWFGFSGRYLGYERSGGGGVNSTVAVAAGQWTHVAVSDSGSEVRFFINGEPAGVSSLSGGVSAPIGRVDLGGDIDGTDHRWLAGSLDEVRLWTAVRSQAAIRSFYLSEVRGVGGLGAVWPTGGRIEATRDLWGEPSGASAGHFGEQIEGILPSRLTVPIATVSPKLDGNVDPATEYAHAERMVLRYGDGPNYRDGRVHLVHTKDYLYLGIEGVRLPSGGAISLDDVIEILVDREGGSLGFNQDLIRGQVFLADSLTTFLNVGRRVIENPITGGQSVFYDWETANPTSLQYEAYVGTERENEITSAPDIEIRIHRSLLGDFDTQAVDRIAIGHRDNGGPNGDAWVPGGAGLTNPAGWAEMRYLDIPATVLPRVNHSGRVVNPVTGAGVGGVEVRLTGRSVYGTTTTSESGDYHFSWIAVGLNDRLRVAIDPPEGSRYDTVIPGAGGEQPIVLGQTEAIFAGSLLLRRDFATLLFGIEAPLPPVELTGFAPAEIWPPVLLRRAGGGLPQKVTSSPTVRIDLSDAHDRMEFFLVMEHCPVSPLASPLCEEGVDYFRLNAVRVDPGGGGAAYFEASIPSNYWAGGVPEVKYPRRYRVAAHDLWPRPGNDPSGVSSWRYAPGTIDVVAPPYPELHGFAFENIADGHDLDDYRAAFYDQSCNPLTMVGFWAFAPIYLDTLGGGECVGMVVTANRFANGYPYTSVGSSMYPEHSNVLYGGGFPHVGAQSPILPARFDTGNPCSPAPLNVWAQVRANHGVQMSSELIGKLLEHFYLLRANVLVDLEHQVNRLRPNPLRYQICIKDGDKGHCVQPLRLIDEVFDDAGRRIPDRIDIEVWDPNHPNETKVIEIALEDGWYNEGKYFYDGFSEPWSGNWMFVYDVEEIWGGERHVPSLDTLGAALPQLGGAGLGGLLQVLVSGDAEPLVVSAEGEVGWNAAGEYVETGAGTIGVPSFNWNPNYAPPLGHLPMMMFHRMETGTPEVRVHNRGQAYKLHTSHEGSMLQLFVDGGVDGEVDTVAFSVLGDVVDGVSLSPGAGGRTVESRIALCRDGSSYPAAIEFGGVSVPAGKSLGVRMLGSGGVEFLNDTGAIVAPDFSILRPGLKGGALRASQVPNLRVPAGAALRIESPDGSTFETLLFGIDETRDGTVDESYLFRSARAGLEQVIGGVPVGFEVEHGEQEVVVRWLDMPGWRLMASRDIEQWDVAGGTVVTDGMAEWRGAGEAGNVFFRLEETGD